MTVVTGAGETVGEAAGPARTRPPVRQFMAGALCAAAVGSALAWAARAGVVDLLVVVAVVQGLLAFAWMVGLSRPGRIGGLLIAALAGASADVAVSVWPHSRLGALLPILALALPVMFVHQLWRGAARNRVVESLGAIAALVFAEVALPALLQLWHEFTGPRAAGYVVSGVAAAASGAVLIGYLVDLVVAAPRFDAAVPRGVLGLVAATGLGGSIGYLMLRQSAEFLGGRGAATGAAVAAIAGLLAVAVSFSVHELPRAARGPRRWIWPVVGALLPLCVVAPVAFVLCLAIHA
jgi:hypothetical protein